MLAFLFFYQPAQLLADGRRKEAAAYLVKTLAAFGLMTALVLALAAAQ
ncbi:MAG: hypothetical protein KGI78_02460 [Patescibacteria group bacterium]|nr:hypothetical protein [Patescibacteria group bacterium]MDE1944344.1 hypothetical protein [Patescibacteria group bacterium]MDE1945338.1 hypothetical protein [Patescibacteria group bacterium]MDE2057694.1 hypothetical protein [Patescibacteria group bacterium]